MAVFVVKRTGYEYLSDIDAGFGCVADLAAELDAHDFIVVDLLRSRPGADRNTRIVTGRSGLLLSRSGIEWIENATRRFVEEEA